jgi:hypothetical protein
MNNNNNPQEAQFVETTGKVMSDTSPLSVTINIKEAWCLVSALQLVDRHPQVSEGLKTLLKSVASQFQTAISNLHPEAETLIQMGWDPTHDVQTDKTARRVVHTAWEVYPDEPGMNTFFGRPQDWGNKSKWLYIPTIFTAMEYESHVHLWINAPQMPVHEALKMASGLITTILLPGERPEKCGNTFLDEDDFWEDSWGEIPEFFDEEPDYEESYD